MIGHVAQDRDYRERFGRFTTKSGRASPVGFCFDRKERGAGDLSALDELAREFGVATAAIATISQIVDVLSQQPVDGRALIDAELRGCIQAYLQQYAPR